MQRELQFGRALLRIRHLTEPMSYPDNNLKAKNTAPGVVSIGFGSISR